MTVELICLALVAAFTGTLWVPYVIDRLRVGPGLRAEVAYPDVPTQLSPWAARLKRAHENAVENLVVFAPLVLVAHVLGRSDAVTEAAAVGYLVCRLAHALAYALAIPWVRTIAFTGGWVAQMAFAAAVLMP